MGDIDDFQLIFGSNPNVAYDGEVHRRILHNRQSLENELFIDRLLHALGVAAVSRSYPPGSNQDLKDLHSQIVSSSSPDHHKSAVLYYLIRDLSHSNHRSARPDALSLPKRYKSFINGLWYLDRLKFEKAMDFLTEPALIPTFPEEILYTLCRHAPDNDSTLPVAYYQTASPAITSSKVLETFFLILCRASVTEAFYFSRSQTDPNHRVLFERLIMFVHQKSKGSIKATRGVELISLPLSEMEEEWFMKFLKEGKGATLSGAADTLTMRSLAIGRPTKLDNPKLRSSEKIDGMSWETLKASSG